jgi:hypothetical protein
MLRYLCLRTLYYVLLVLTATFLFPSFLLLRKGSQKRFAHISLQPRVQYTLYADAIFPAHVSWVEPLVVRGILVSPPDDFIAQRVKKQVI